MQNRIFAVVPSSAFCNSFGKSSSPSTNHTFGVFLGLWLWPTFFCIRSHSIFATSFWAVLLLPRKGIPVRTGGWIAQLWPRRCSWVACMWLVCGFRHGGACGLCQWAAFEHSALFKRLWSVFQRSLPRMLWARCILLLLLQLVLQFFASSGWTLWGAGNGPEPFWNEWLKLVETCWN